MIDPSKITNFDRSREELEEFILFAIAVAGKQSTVVARTLAHFLSLAKSGNTPFEKVRHLLRVGRLGWALRKVGFGQYRNMFLAYQQAVTLDLSNLSVQALEAVHKIGPKTSRFIMLHSVRDQEVAVLDTHVLKFLAGLGHRVPRSTPTTKRAYARAEQLFLAEARRRGCSVAELDLRVWESYRKVLAA